MKHHLSHHSVFFKSGTLLKLKVQSKQISNCFLLLIFFTFCCKQINAQGTWKPVTDTAMDLNEGVMLLLSDGTVMCKTASGGNDGNGNIWDKLTPDIHGSYINGTWTRLDSMYNTRLYFSSQVLRDGRVFVAGGEYGTGGALAEVYDPVADNWTMTPTQPTYFGDANSEILPDGRVLEALLDTLTYNFDTTIIYDPVSNSWSTGPDSHGDHDESAWVKLPDNSILFVDINSTNSERYIPSLNQWIVDGTVSDSLYDDFDSEAGAGLLLPNGKVFFLGSTGHTAYYTPSGSIAPGTWTAGPDIPNGTGTTDAAASMMVNGKILCAASPLPAFYSDYPSPTYYYEFNYSTNTFTQINAPNGSDTTSEPCFQTNMLNLPDGTILYADQYSSQYYVYTPDGTPLASGKPTISSISHTGCTYTITGTLFNGISEGSGYGDDWQMATNYPLVRLTSGTNVYYARTFNWNRTGVMTGSLPDTTEFTLPASLPPGTYSLVVTANGISSDSVPFTYSPCNVGITEIGNSTGNMSVYPNPADESVTIAFNSKDTGNYKLSMIDVFGKTIMEENNKAVVENNSLLINISGIAKGVYMVIIQKGNDVFKTKVMVK